MKYTKLSKEDKELSYKLRGLNLSVKAAKEALEKRETVLIGIHNPAGCRGECLVIWDGKLRHKNSRASHLKKKGDIMLKKVVHCNTCNTHNQDITFKNAVTNASYETILFDETSGVNIVQLTSVAALDSWAKEKEKWIRQRYEEDSSLGSDDEGSESEDENDDEELDVDIMDTKKQKKKVKSTNKKNIDTNKKTSTKDDDTSDEETDYEDGKENSTAAKRGVNTNDTASGKRRSERLKSNKPINLDESRFSEEDSEREDENITYNSRYTKLSKEEVELSLKLRGLNLSVKNAKEALEKRETILIGIHNPAGCRGETLLTWDGQLRHLQNRASPITKVGDIKLKQGVHCITCNTQNRNFTFKNAVTNESYETILFDETSGVNVVQLASVAALKSWAKEKEKWIRQRYEEDSSLGSDDEGSESEDENDDEELDEESLDENDDEEVQSSDEDDSSSDSADEESESEEEDDDKEGSEEEEEDIDAYNPDEGEENDQQGGFDYAFDAEADEQEADEPPILPRNNDGDGGGDDDSYVDNNDVFRDALETLRDGEDDNVNVKIHANNDRNNNVTRMGRGRKLLPIATATTIVGIVTLLLCPFVGDIIGIKNPLFGSSIKTNSSLSAQLEAKEARLTHDIKEEQTKAAAEEIMIVTPENDDNGSDVEALFIYLVIHKCTDIHQSMFIFTTDVPSAHIEIQNQDKDEDTSKSEAGLPSSSPSSPSSSSQPSSHPSVQPTTTTAPSSVPSSNPTSSGVPSLMPSDVPSISSQPSSVPSAVPSISTEPSLQPSQSPTDTMIPSSMPSQSTSSSSQPSSHPSSSSAPSHEPSVQPSDSSESTKKNSKARKLDGTSYPTFLPSLAPVNPNEASAKDKNLLPSCFGDNCTVTPPSPSSIIKRIPSLIPTPAINRDLKDDNEGRNCADLTDVNRQCHLPGNFPEVIVLPVCQSKVQEMKELATSLKGEVNGLNQSLNEREASEIELKHEISDLKDQRNEMYKTQQLKGSLLDAEEELGRSETEKDRLEETITSLGYDNQDLRGQVAQHQATVTSLGVDKQRLQHAAAVDRARIASLEKEIDQQQTEAAQYQATITSLGDDNQDLQAQVAQQYQATITNNEDLLAQVAQYQAKFTSLGYDNQDLQAQVSQQQAKAELIYLILGGLLLMQSFLFICVIWGKLMGCRADKRRRGD